MPLTGCEGEGDLIFLLDSSSESSTHDFENAKDFVRAIVAKLDIGTNVTRVGIAVTTQDTQGRETFLLEYR